MPVLDWKQWQCGPGQGSGEGAECSGQVILEGELTTPDRLEVEHEEKGREIKG